MEINATTRFSRPNAACSGAPEAGRAVWRRTWAASQMTSRARNSRAWWRSMRWTRCRGLVSAPSCLAPRRLKAAADPVHRRRVQCAEVEGGFGPDPGVDSARRMSFLRRGAEGIIVVRSISIRVIMDIAMFRSIRTRSTSMSDLNYRGDQIYDAVGNDPGSSHAADEQTRTD